MGAEATQPRGNEGRKVKHCCVSVGSYQLAVARAFMHSFHSEASLSDVRNVLTSAEVSRIKTVLAKQILCPLAKVRVG